MHAGSHATQRNATQRNATQRNATQRTLIRILDRLAKGGRQPGGKVGWHCPSPERQHSRMRAGTGGERDAQGRAVCVMSGAWLRLSKGGLYSAACGVEGVMRGNVVVEYKNVGSRDVSSALQVSDGGPTSDPGVGRPSTSSPAHSRRSVAS